MAFKIWIRPGNTSTLLRYRTSGRLVDLPERKYPFSFSLSGFSTDLTNSQSPLKVLGLMKKVLAPSCFRFAISPSLAAVSTWTGTFLTATIRLMFISVSWPPIFGMLMSSTIVIWYKATWYDESFSTVGCSNAHATRVYHHARVRKSSISSRSSLM